MGHLSGGVLGCRQKALLCCSIEVPENSKFSAWVAEEKTVGHEQSANAIEEDGWIFALDHEHEEPCELIMIDSGASVLRLPT